MDQLWASLGIAAVLVAMGICILLIIRSDR